MTSRLIPPDTNASTKQERHDFWSMVIEEYEQSGLSLSNFCEQHGLNPPQVYRWRSNIKRAHQRAQTKTPATITDFVEVTLPDFTETGQQKCGRNTRSASCFVLKLKQGIELVIPHFFDEKEFVKIIKAIGITL